MNLADDWNYKIFQINRLGHWAKVVHIKLYCCHKTYANTPIFPQKKKHFPFDCQIALK